MGKKLKTIKNEIKPKTRKGKILTVVFGVVSPLVLGIAAGIVINKFILVETTNLDDINMDDARIDETEEAMKKYNALNKNGTVQVSDYTVHFNAAEMFAVAYARYSSYENSYSLTVGSTDASGIDQSIRAALIRNGDSYFEESLSKSSMVSLANRMYLDPDATLRFYEGKAVTETAGEYKPEHKLFTSEEYASIFGKTPARPSIYIVNSKTILEGTDKVNKTSTGYTISVSLDTKTGVYDYMKQMKNISNLSGYPSFKYCNLTLYTDKDLLPTKLHVEEKYTAKLGIFGSTCAAKLDISYAVNTGNLIPDLSTPIEYPEAI